MTLGYKTRINGKPTDFVGKIWSGLVDLPEIKDLLNAEKELIHMQYFLGSIERGLMNRIEKYKPKLHTIRTDEKNRWKAGNKIHSVVKNRTPERFQFAPVVLCKSVQKIMIRHSKSNMDVVKVWIDGELIYEGHKWIRVNSKIIDLAVNDGFDSTRSFFEYFDRDFFGKIIHWTSLKY